MDKENKIEVFMPLTKNFETNIFKEYFLDMVTEMPDYIFTMPSSTSGKYHNAKQCETYGQLYHIYMFDSILNHLLRLKGNREKFPTPEERDAMRCVPTFHDAVKCGWNGSRYTVQDHPLLAARWVMETRVKHDIPVEYKQMIADMCESHSGEWNKSKSGKIIMSEPRNDREFLIHECDILSSRPDIDYVIPDELKESLPDVESPDIDTYIISFGKHKGKTLTEVNKIDPGYIVWAKENITREPLKTLLKAIS